MTPKTVTEIQRQVTSALAVNQKMLPLRLGREAEKQGLVFWNHFRNTETLKSLRTLAKLKRAGDVATLTRSMFESVLNMGLLTHLPSKDGVEKYKKFLSVEILKHYEHAAAIDPDYTRELYTPEKIALVRKEAREYETTYGKPKPSWSGLDNLSICRILDRNYPPLLDRRDFFEFTYCHIYRFGSPAVHRSLFGLAQSGKIVDSENALTGEQGYDISSSEEGLVFHYLHGLISYIASIRVLGKAFELHSLEDYFQKRAGALILEQEG